MKINKKRILYSNRKQVTDVNLVKNEAHKKIGYVSNLRGNIGKWINRGYYMAARKYEISLQVLKNISRVSASNEHRPSWTGCERSPIHRCYPTTVWCGNFCLLCFHPGPVRSSLTNLENSDSSVFPILTPNLARTPDLHRTTAPRNPTLKPFRDPSLQVAGLQACATTPGWLIRGKINLLFCLFTSLWCDRK